MDIVFKCCKLKYCNINGIFTLLPYYKHAKSIVCCNRNMPSFCKNQNIKQVYGIF